MEGIIIKIPNGRNIFYFKLFKIKYNNNKKKLK